MADLLCGTRALRGRAALELRVQPFGYRGAREYWGIGNVAAAFAHNAIIGGTPGYRELAPDPHVPGDSGHLGGWLARNVLRPSMPLFDEARGKAEQWQARTVGPVRCRPRRYPQFAP